jgi:hypothetical protein
MFQLIVAVIAIALVIALTLASIFYGGEAFTRSSLKANVAAMVNQAQQISAAHTLYKTDKAVSPTNGLAGLVPDYLADEPVAPKIVEQVNDASVSWTLDTVNKIAYIELGADAQETCDAVADNGVGECTDGAGNAGTARYEFKL